MSNEIDIYAGLPADPGKQAAYRIAVMQAELEGKPVQYCSKVVRLHIPWIDIRCSPERCATWQWEHCDYRIDPASRPKKFVPWTADDVPALCWLRTKGMSSVGGSIVTQVDSVAGCLLYFAFDNTHTTATFQQALEHFEWSADRKTWAPCGKEI